MKTSLKYGKIKYNILPFIFLAISMSFSIHVKAQSDNQSALLQMIDEDRTTVDAIAGYDEKVQRDILQVAQTPEVLNRIEELQNRSKNQFRAIINDYGRDEQAAFYEMARYPSLISDLVRNGKPSNSEVNQIVLNYPEDIHETAKKYARRYFEVFIRIDQLNSEIDGAFQSYLEPYDSDTRESVNTLLAYPEIVSILVEDKDFTALLGAVYSEDPNWIERNLHRISKELAEQNQEDLDAYKTQIQNDPEAYNEMLDASEKFAKENNEVRYVSSSAPIVEVNVVNSYPYWFGYPYWYSNPYWRPRPVYYHTGFYRNNYGNIVFVGLPSYHFIHWQSYNHPTLFPHLSYNYYSYYQNHYVNRYRDSHRPVSHHTFYRSIESNIINNPRVNNSNLERIDHQRGNNIVRRPNSMESGSARRGNSGITRQGEYSNARQRAGTSGTVNRRGNESINRNGNGQRSYERPAGKVNRREYNTVNPVRSEGSINRRGSGVGNGTIRRESVPASTNRGGANTERSRQQPAADNMGNSAASGRNASARQRREASQPQQRSAAPERAAGRPQQRESKAVNTQSSNRREARENNSSTPAASSKTTNREKGNGRQR